MMVVVQLKTLRQPASRLVTSALTQFAEPYPRTLMLSVILPIIASETCNAFQADVVLKLVKAVYNFDHHPKLLRFTCFCS